MKKLALLMIFVLMIGFIASPLALANEHDDDVIDEYHGEPILVLGEQLDETQRNEVRETLDAQDAEELIVTGQDLSDYIGGNPNANMYSSAKVTHMDDGHGIEVDIVTPDNITEVTREMYENALLTAGVENAMVEVASPLRVTGHSALVGIYKAFHVEGGSLDQDRMEVANDELNVATEIAEEEENVDSDEITALLTEIKKAISEQNPASREDVEQIVDEKINELNLELSEENRQMLIDLVDRMRSLNIDFDRVSEQLENIVGDLQDRLDDLTDGNADGIWNAIRNFFISIANWFQGLFAKI
ncbi:DUF1002 domain-containing protein [Halalkalibacillus halophilus]|uniref:DUF1002 domain-containing protein n=1 Tax=Halalkalibacillus halophilus TaxID=392827 RepID=UPI00040470C4|nr:DUF1002 domain-containing protein [Halalkalibacillus halophilus]